MRKKGHTSWKGCMLTWVVELPWRLALKISLLKHVWASVTFALTAWSMTFTVTSLAHTPTLDGPWWIQCSWNHFLGWWWTLSMIWWRESCS
jgi:hypothetical protein